MKRNGGLVVLMAALTALGCETTNGFLAFEVDLPPMVVTSAPHAQIMPPAPPHIGARLIALQRGVRGGTAVLALKNTRTDGAELVLDWAKLSIRLSSGQFRKAMDDDEYLKVAMQFDFRAYGDQTRDKNNPDQPPRIYPHHGEVYRIKPGEEMVIALHFGAPAEEKSMMLSFQEALHWENAAGAEAITPALQMAVQLPSLSEEPKEGSYWPKWMQLNLEFGN
jgi:hypothetical protein